MNCLLTLISRVEHLMAVVAAMVVVVVAVDFCYFWLMFAVKLTSGIIAFPQPTYAAITPAISSSLPPHRLMRFIDFALPAQSYALHTTPTHLPRCMMF